MADNVDTRNEALRDRVDQLERAVELLKQNVVDLSDIVIGEVPLDEADLVFPRGLRFSVCLSDDNAFFVASNEELRVHTFGASRAELLSMVRFEVAFLWTEYASADDSELSDDAIELKRTLRELGEVVADAPQGA
jgi:predicted RNase H-like HicB family nuclease